MRRDRRGPPGRPAPGAGDRGGAHAARGAAARPRARRRPRPAGGARSVGAAYPEAIAAADALSGRAKIAIEAYTYAHYPIVAGVVVTALGVEEVVAHVGETTELGFFDASALYGGLALYLLGHAAFKRRLYGTISAPRLIAAATLAAFAPLSAQAPPLLGLALLVAIVGSLVALEAARYASVRESLRETRA